MNKSRTIRFAWFAALAIAVTVSAGCASQAELAHEERMYDKQVTAAKEATPTPIFQLTAHEGQQINLTGVKSLSVYNPSDGTNKTPVYVPRKSSAEVAWDGLIGLGKTFAAPVATVVQALDAGVTARRSSDNAVRIRAIDADERKTIDVEALQQAGKVTQVQPCIVTETVIQCD